MWQLAPVAVRNGAACADKDSATFDDVDDFTHPELTPLGRRELNQERRLRARVICAGCPVKTQCLEWALKEKVDTGTLGGLTPGDREQLLKGGAPHRADVRQKHHSVSHRHGDQMVRAFLGGASVTAVAQQFAASRNSVLVEIRRTVV